ncbi:MAG: alpha/beta hydrolase [Chloroflexi bacterium]|nr:alpha/beta hydrolase [Chloroflexota bacterium]
MPTIKTGEVNLEYYVEGAGPPLLLIRGFTADCSNWSDRFLQPLQERFTCIRFSNRGTGLSDKPAEPTTIRQMAGDAVALMDALDIERAHIFGVSMGGMIAQEIVLNYADRVNGLVLGCTTPGGENAVAAGPDVIALISREPGLSPRDQKRMSWPAIVSPEFIDSDEDFLEEMLRLSLVNPTPLATVVQQMAAIRQFDTFDRLPQIKIPTLVIHGDSDRLLPHDNGALIAGQIAGAEMKTLAGAGHVFFWEKPTESAEAISEFLARIPQTA